MQWHVYEDLPYALERPAERDAAKEALIDHGFKLEPLETNVDRARKQGAVACYRSQLRALGDRVPAAVEAQERLYRLVGS